MKKPELSRRCFAALHARILELCYPDQDLLSQVSELPDYIFYGFSNDHVSDTLKEKSISGIISKSLKEDGKIGKGLYNGKTQYNKHVAHIDKIGPKQLGKLFRFIDPNVTGRKSQLDKLEEFAVEFSERQADFPPPFIQKNSYQNKSKPSNLSDLSNMPSEISHIKLEQHFIGNKELIENIKAVLEDTKWALYTYNFNYKRIVKAQIQIDRVNHLGNQIRLDNPQYGFKYEGILNLSFVEYKAIIIDLISKGIKDKHIHLKMHMDFHYNDVNLSIGKSMGFGRVHAIYCSNALLIKLNDEDELSNKYYYPDSPKLHDAIKKHLDPNFFGLKTITRASFLNLEDLNRYLSNYKDD